MSDTPNKPSKSPITQLIAQRRRELGLKQDDLAKIAHMTLDKIKSIESGRTIPKKIGLLKVLAKALQIPLEEILTVAGIELPANSTHEQLESLEESPKQRSPLADFIVRRREILGINQLELADSTGVPSGTVASIEAGHSDTPKSETLRKLAKGLRVPYEELDCIAQGIPYKPGKKTKEPLRDFELYLLNHDNIPTEVAETLIEMIRTVIRRYD